jgi:hypothetical protein
MTGLYVPELDEDVDTLSAALEYARCHWYVGPCDQRQKSPGSVLGIGWQYQTSRDPEQIVAWFAGTDHGLFLHVGRSGAVVLDVDDYAALPGWVDDLITEHQPPFQSTRTNDHPRRGHYVFAQPDDRLVGNRQGDLGKGWGEVRGKNGVIVVQPTRHEKEGGQYQWRRTGPVPFVPKLTDALPDATDSTDSATDSAVRAFLAEHDEGDHPQLLQVVLGRFTETVAAGGSRHDACLDCLTWAMRESRAGLYSARAAVDGLWDLFSEALEGEPRRFPRSEFRGLLAWAVAQAQESDPAEVRSRVEGRLAGRGSEPGTRTPAPGEGQTAPRPSWRAEDLSAILDGSHQPAEPTLLPRADGQCLLYPGKVHSVHGESESGKSLLMHAETARLLRDGHPVVIVDWESNAQTVVGRLLLMGAPREAIREHLDYIRPEAAPTALAERDAWEALLATQAALVVLDGVTEALSSSGHSTLDNDEVTSWMREVPRRIAQRTGAAVVLVDHVTKSTEGRGRFAIGAQAKMSALDGASYSVEVVQPLGRGLRGSLRLWVGKDREGSVRPHCGRFNPSDRTQLAATVVVDSTSGPITTEVLPPGELVGSDPKPFRPTGLMERLSEALERAGEALSTNALVKGSDWVSGKAQAKRTALDLLVDEGYVTRVPGPRSVALHTTAHPYREATDPRLDRGPSRSLFSPPGPSGTGSPLEGGTRVPVETESSVGPGPARDPVGPSGPSGRSEPASAGWQG